MPNFVELEAQLGESRGPNGKPSVTDFLMIDLPTISIAFAQDFDEFPLLFRDRDDYRYLVTTGKHSPRRSYATVVASTGTGCEMRHLDYIMQACPTYW